MEIAAFEWDNYTGLKGSCAFERDNYTGLKELCSATITSVFQWDIMLSNPKRSLENPFEDLFKNLRII